jgi:hypothetical protein
MSARDSSLPGRQVEEQPAQEGDVAVDLGAKGFRLHPDAGAQIGQFDGILSADHDQALDAGPADFRVDELVRV